MRQANDGRLDRQARSWMFITPFGQAQSVSGLGRPLFSCSGRPNAPGYFKVKWARRFLPQQDSPDSVQTGFSLP